MMTEPPSLNNKVVSYQVQKYGSYVDMEGGIKNEAELIRRYRETSLVPECDSAIEDIVNECITSDTSDKIVSLDLRDVKL